MNQTSPSQFMRDVYDFCQKIRLQYGGGFRESKVNNGVAIVGEYGQNYGKQFYMQLFVTLAGVDVRIYDHSRRLVFSDTYRKNPSTSRKLISFIQRSIQMY